MNDQPISFADLAGSCPDCGMALRLIDLSLIARCDSCCGDFWCDDEAAKWEAMSMARKGGSPTPLPRNNSETLKNQGVSSRDKRGCERADSA